ncbi:MAG: T9SS type A sorting domain-containing protein [Bacteroidota bacterium]
MYKNNKKGIYTIMSISLLMFVYSKGLSQSWDIVKTFGSPGFDEGINIDIDNDKNIYFAGIYTEAFDIDSVLLNLDNSGSCLFRNDIILVKIDSLGNTNWIKQINGKCVDNIFSIIEKDEWLYLSGNINSFSNDTGHINFCDSSIYIDQTSAFIAKLNANNGELDWLKLYPTSSNSVYVTSDVNNDNELYCVISFSDNINIEGTAYSTNTSNPDVIHSILLKYNEFGSLIWNVHIKNNNEDSGLLRIEAGKELFIYGIYNDTVFFGNDTIDVLINSAGTYISKVDTSGNHLWTKSIQCLNMESYHMTTDNNSNIYITGMYSDTLRFLGNVFLPIYNDDVFIAKIDSTGSLIWWKQIVGNLGFYYESWVRNLAVNDIEEVFFYNEISLVYDTVIIDSVWLVPNGVFNHDFVCKLSKDGVCQWGFTMPVIDHFSINAINAKGNDLFITGDFSGVNNQLGSQSLYSNGSSDMYIANFNYLLNQYELINKGNISCILYPNPAKNNINVKVINHKKWEIKLEIVDMHGRVVQEIEFGNNINVDISDLQPGLYFVKIITGNNTILKKFIKQ